MKERKSADQETLTKLQAELRRSEEKLNRLYEAVEAGVIPLDETLQRRAQQAKAAREAVLVEMAGLRRVQAMPIERILPSQVQAFSKALRAKLRDRSSTFAKDYLRTVVSEIRVTGQTATIAGSYAQLMSAVAQKKKESDQVPSFMRDWRARQDSNPRPPGS